VHLRGVHLRRSIGSGYYCCTPHCCTPHCCTLHCCTLPTSPDVFTSLGVAVRAPLPPPSHHTIQADLYPRQWYPEPYHRGETRGQKRARLGDGSAGAGVGAVAWADSVVVSTECAYSDSMDSDSRDSPDEADEVLEAGCSGGGDGDDDYMPSD
jgi:hypothetical protein